jgi:hypothetical protein
LDAAIVQLVPVPGRMRSQGFRHDGTSMVGRLFRGGLWVAKASA